MRTHVHVHSPHPKAPAQGGDWQWPLKGCVNCDEHKTSLVFIWEVEKTAVPSQEEHAEKRQGGPGAFLVITIAILVN